MNLVIRTDASTQIGTGHLMRCLALAQAVQANQGRVTFVMAASVPALQHRLQAEGFTPIALSAPIASSEDAAATIEIVQAQGAKWLIVDGYQFDSHYQQFIKKSGLKLLFFDDYQHCDRYSADLILNQNIGANEALYREREPYTKLLLGTRYVLLRQEFLHWRKWQRTIQPIARKVLITLGGADPANVTLQVIQALDHAEIQELEAIVVIGSSNPHLESLQTAAQHSKTSIQLVQNATNMPELMSWADVAIAAGGTTSWELAFMGLPTLMLILAENQRAIAEKLGALGVVINLGWHENLTTKAIATSLQQLLTEDATLRLKMSQQGRTWVDGAGADRILRHLVAPVLQFRRAEPADCELFWIWANDPSVRAVSFTSEPIPWKTHIQWYAQKMSDPSCYLYVVSDRQTPIGSVRFEAVSPQAAEMSVSLAPDYRGLGYGRVVIEKAIALLFQETSLQCVQAFIKPDNFASIRTFETAQFQRVGETLIKGILALHYQRSRDKLS